MKRPERRARRRLFRWRERIDAWAAYRRPWSTCGGVGCNGCCRNTTLVAAVEVRVIAEQLTPEQWARVLAVPEDAAVTAHCPLLDPSGACGIYEERPLVCRAYMVSNDPDLCYPENGEGVLSVLFESEVAQQLRQALPKEGPSLSAALRAAYNPRRHGATPHVQPKEDPQACSSS